MARAFKSSDPFLITIETPRGGILRGVRRSGDIVVRSCGRHHVRGRVQPGLSVRDVLAEWSKFAPEHRVRASTEDLDAPIVTQAQADKRERARARRAERSEAAAEARAMREHDALGEAARSSPDAPLRADSESVATYADLARINFRPRDTRLAYVVTMARFHGGAASPNLHAPMAAAFALRRSYPWRAQLDELADSVARRAFGSDLRAARVWYRALGAIERDRFGERCTRHGGG